jgi:hypothetical protein
MLYVNAEIVYIYALSSEFRVANTFFEAMAKF